MFAGSNHLGTATASRADFPPEYLRFICPKFMKTLAMASPDSKYVSSTLKGRAYGVPIELSGSPVLMNEMSRRVPPGWTTEDNGTKCELSYALEGDDTGSWYGLKVDNRLVARTRSLDQILGKFESHIQLEVATRCREYLFVHAGVVSWCGGGIILPGRSYTGKSTIVAALARVGAVYYSDEYALIDKAGYIHPYPRALRLRNRDSFERITPAELGQPVPPPPVAPLLILLCSYCPGAKWNPTPVTQGLAVLELLRNTVAARQYPVETLAALKQVATQAQTSKSLREDACHVVEHILQLAETTQRKKAGCSEGQKLAEDRFPIA
jgi:hypothetical protein